MLLCRHWQTPQGPSRQRSPTARGWPCCSQPAQGSVRHLEEGPPLACQVGLPGPPTCPDLPRGSGFPGLPSDKTRQVLGRLGCSVSLSPRSHPCTRETATGPRDGRGSKLCQKPLKWGLGGQIRTPASPLTNPATFRGMGVQTRGPIPAPRLLGSPQTPFRLGGHKADAGEGQGFPKTLLGVLVFRLIGLGGCSSFGVHGAYGSIRSEKELTSSFLTGSRR